MLYQIGSLTLDTRPFNVDRFNRSAEASIAKKPVMQTLPPGEFMGEGEDKIMLSGQLLPFKTGGLSELEIADAFRRNGTQLPVMRGDGKMIGWYAIERISESHKELMRNGVGFVVKYRISMRKTVPSTGSSEGGGLIGSLISLFDVT